MYSMDHYLGQVEERPAEMHCKSKLPAVKDGGPAVGEEGPMPRAGEEKCCVGCGAVSELEWGLDALRHHAPGLVALCTTCNPRARASTPALLLFKPGDLVDSCGLRRTLISVPARGSRRPAAPTVPP